MKEQEKEIIIKVLTIVREYLGHYSYIDARYGGGICGILDRLVENRLITEDESTFVHCYIYKNRPLKGKHYDKSLGNKATWWWQCYKPEPRIAWIDYILEKLNK